jgi:hypothetical protein
MGSWEGNIVNKLREKSGINFIGLEPHLPTSQIIIGSVTVMKGFADKIPLDMVVTLISVYEHLLPRQRLATLNEINRVLKDKGILAGQIPNTKHAFPY